MVTAIASVSVTPSARPFLKWAGGKGRLLDQYWPYFPQQFRRYHEPFLGGGAVFFSLADQFRTALLADLNEELVNVYQCVRDDIDELIDRLAQHKVAHGHSHYYAVRAQQALPDPVERAARLIYLNKTCFNGLYRENSKGHFNVPIGRYKNPNICDEATLRHASTALQSADIACAPFTDVLTQARSSQDFVYFDPPYHPISNTSSFTSYNRRGFHPQDQEQLQQTFAELAGRGVKVMLSNSDCLFTRELYRDFYIHPIQASRAINSKAKRRGKIPELLITSYVNG